MQSQPASRAASPSQAGLSSSIDGAGAAHSLPVPPQSHLPHHTTEAIRKKPYQLSAFRDRVATLAHMDRFVRDFCAHRHTQPPTRRMAEDARARLTGLHTWFVGKTRQQLASGYNGARKADEELVDLGQRLMRDVEAWGTAAAPRTAAARKLQGTLADLGAMRHAAQHLGRQAYLYFLRRETDPDAPTGMQLLGDACCDAEYIAWQKRHGELTWAGGRAPWTTCRATY